MGALAPITITRVSFAMLHWSPVTNCVVAHAHGRYSHGCGSPRALGAREPSRHIRKAIVCHSHARGFTLVEILVVIAIVGIMLTLVRVNLSSDPLRILNNETQLIARLIEAARDEAITRGRPLAWSVKDGRIVFWQRGREKPDQWVDLVDNDVRPQKLDAELVDLKIAGSRADLDSLLILTPDGVQPSFEARFRVGQYQAAVEGDVLGQIHSSAIP